MIFLLEEYNIIKSYPLDEGGNIINTFSQKVFICFAAEDRYKIAEPIVYHLKNYGIDTWYDRHTLLMGDNRIAKNLDEGASQCGYAVIILSTDTKQSACAMEEISILHQRYEKGNVIIFPVLYEISPGDIPSTLQWVQKLIYKEASRNSGTLEICNHIACKITEDILQDCCYQKISDIIINSKGLLPSSVYALLKNYQKIAIENLNSRVTLLYAIFTDIIHSPIISITPVITMVSKIFERLFSETLLNLPVDYRELWLLENSICILIDSYVVFCTDAKI